MSMKRCFELPASPSLSLLGRAVLVGSVLSLAAACARKDAAKSDSVATASDSATTTTSAMTATAASPVESVSTGETTVSAESKANPTVAASNVTSGTTNTAVKPTPSTTPTAPAHHAVHHADSSATKRVAAAPAAAPAPASTSTARTAADTGQKTAADTSKKTAAAGGAVDHLLVSPQEYEGWKMFSVYCYRCHGVDAMGGGIAPNLRHSVSSEGSVTHDVFITTVTNGRLDKGMPSWKALLSPEQMEDLWLYINARSSGRLAPGRPHMAQGANP
jgi:mono/diheme cytochrome c family protein